MPQKSFSWMIGGPQGSGINTSAELLAKVLSRGGYQVFGNIEYNSNIKGKHSYYRLRIAVEPVRSHLEEIHLLVALEDETLFGDLYHEWPAHRGHIHEVAEGGGILFQEGTQGIEKRLNGCRVHLFPIPYNKFVEASLTAVGKGSQAHEYRIMNNTAALGHFVDVAAVGGPQGGGINTSAELLAKVLSRGGYQVFGNIEYNSNIKGKHSYYRLRIAVEPVRSHLEEIHLLVALEDETLFGDLYHEWPAHRGHIHEVAEGGGILFQEGTQGIEKRLNGCRVHLFPIPYNKFVEASLTAVGKGSQAHEYRIMNNTAALGAAIGAMGYDIDRVAAVILEGFKGKASKVGEMNVNCAHLAYDYARKHFAGKLEFSLPPAPAKPRKQIMIKGTQAVGIAKLKAGCGIQTYYPISPATDESVYLEGQQSAYKLVVLQTEDEVSAIDAAVMAAHGGVRASTSTSGRQHRVQLQYQGQAQLLSSAHRG